MELAAPPEAAFEALTDPAQLEEWWSTPESCRTSDWMLEPSAGGERRVRTEALGGTEAGSPLDWPRLLKSFTLALHERLVLE